MKHLLSLLFAVAVISAQGVKVYDENGNYLGKAGVQKDNIESILNPNGFYGSTTNPHSVNNPTSQNYIQQNKVSSDFPKRTFYTVNHSESTKQLSSIINQLPKDLGSAIAYDKAEYQAEQPVKSNRVSEQQLEVILEKIKKLESEKAAQKTVTAKKLPDNLFEDILSEHTKDSIRLYNEGYTEGVRARRLQDDSLKLEQSN